MRVETLYFSGRPNHPQAVDCVREVLEQEDTQAEMVEVEVRDLQPRKRIGFLGSPTIPVDGQDVEPEARAERAFGRRTGVPLPEWIRAAVLQAKGRYP